MIRTSGLSTAAGAANTVSDVTMAVGAGECVGIVGPAGSGASALLAILATMRRPSSGQLAIAGVDAIAHPFVARAHLCWIGGAYPRSSQTIREHLTLLARLRRGADGVTRVADALTSTQIDGETPLDRLTKTATAGLGVAVARVVGASLLLVDEPFTDECAGLWRDALRETRRDGGTVVFTAPAAVGLPPVWDRLLTIEQGRVVDERAAAPPDTSWRPLG